MNTSFWAMLYWISGFLANVGLLYTLLVRVRWKEFRVFSIFVGFQVLRTLTLFAVRRTTDAHTYFWSFWSLAVLDYLLQLSIIIEIGLIALRPLVDAVPEAGTKVVAWSVTALVVAGVVSTTIFPGPSNGSSIWDTRISLFTSLLTAQCYLVLSRSINRLGIRMRAHVLAIGNGLVIWSTVALIRDGAYAATGWHHEFPMLDQFQMVAYIGATLYWALSLWPEDPIETQTVAPLLASAYERLVEKQSEIARDEEVGRRAG